MIPAEVPPQNTESEVFTVTETERFIYSQMSPDRQEQLLLDEFRKLDDEGKAWIFSMIFSPFCQESKKSAEQAEKAPQLRIVK